MPSYDSSYKRVHSNWFQQNWKLDVKPRDFISNLGYTNLTGMREIMLVAQDVLDCANLDRTHKALAKTLFACAGRFIGKEKELNNAAKMIINFVLEVKKTFASKSLSLLTSEPE